MLAFEAGRKKRIRVNTISAGIHGLKHLVLLIVSFFSKYDFCLCRINRFKCVGPLGSRAAKAIGFIDTMIDYSFTNAPIQKELNAGNIIITFEIVVFSETNICRLFVMVLLTLLSIFVTEEVGNTAAFLASPLASAITGAVIYVDNGLNAMGVGVDSPVFKDLNIPKQEH